MIVNKLARTALLPLIMLFFSWTPASGAIPKITKVQTTESSMASQVEIVADAPVTYTYYSLSSPPRAVIDIALADPSQVSRQLSMDSPLITRITVERIEAPPIPLTRMTISLAHDAYLAVRSSPEDKGRLLVTLVKKMVSAPGPAETDEEEKDQETAGKKPVEPTTGAPDTTPKDKRLDDLADDKGVAAPAVAKASPPAIGSAPVAPPSSALPAPVTGKPDAPEAPTTASPADQKAASPLSKKTDLRPVVPVVEEPAAIPNLTVSSSSVTLTGFTSTKAPRVFRLAGPNRLVMDIPGGKDAARQKEYPFNRFGFKKVRIGFYPDKVRYVFDAGHSPLPAYRVDRSSKALTVIFGKQ